MKTRRRYKGATIQGSSKMKQEQAWTKLAMNPLFASIGNDKKLQIANLRKGIKMHQKQAAMHFDIE